MAEPITIKALQDASLDAKSLEEVVNGNESKQVTTRKGETYPSVKKAIKTMFENGGLPATPFKTKALMTASALVDGKYAMVTDDTVADNNGLYVKAAGAWVKSAYSPSSMIQNEVARLYGSNISVNINMGFIASASHSSGEGVINPDLFYVHTDSIKLRQGDKLKARASASPSVLVLSLWDSEGNFISEIKRGGDNIATDYEYTAQADEEYVKVCSTSKIVPLDEFKISVESKDSLRNLRSSIETLGVEQIRPQTVRKAVINFQFDDGNGSDELVYSTFKEHNLTCGFALVANNTTDYARYLRYQNDGFEVLSHSIDGTPMGSGVDDISVIENKMKASKQRLESEGFNIRGWVTPSSQLHTKYLPTVKKYYEFAHTVAFGIWTTSSETVPYNTFTEDTRELKRMSLEANDTTSVKAAIDKAIEDNAFLTFYAHALPSSKAEGLSVQKLEEILTHAKNKADNGECLILKPSDAYVHYYSLRHSDIINLIG